MQRWKMAVTTTSAIVLAAAGSIYLFWTRPCPNDRPRIHGVCVTSTTAEATEQMPRSSERPLNASEYATFAEVPNVPDQTLRYTSAPSLTALTERLNTQISQTHPGLRPVYIKPGATTLPDPEIQMVLTKQVRLAIVQRPLADTELATAKAQGMTLVQMPIALYSIAFFVNSQLSVTGLTLDQLKKIYTRDVKNWRWLGGQDQVITSFSLDPKQSALTTLLTSLVLRDAPLTPSEPYIGGVAIAVQDVATTLGGIGYGPVTQVCQQSNVKPLAIGPDQRSLVSPCIGDRVNVKDLSNNTYPLAKPLFLVLRRDGTEGEQAGIAYTQLLLSNQGQQLIEQAGFVGIGNQSQPK